MKQRSVKQKNQSNGIFFKTAAINKKEVDEGERETRTAGSSVGVASEVKSKERLDGDSISALESKMFPS